MNKYAHAFNIIENWERVEEYYGGNKWELVQTKTPDIYSLKILNDHRIFRIKREPRRVWVNFHESDPQCGTAYPDMTSALNGARLTKNNLAVEFVEVIR